MFIPRQIYWDYLFIYIYIYFFSPRSSYALSSYFLNYDYWSILVKDIIPFSAYFPFYPKTSYLDECSLCGIYPSARSIVLMNKCIDGFQYLYLHSFLTWAFCLLFVYDFEYMNFECEYLGSSVELFPALFSNRFLDLCVRRRLKVIRFFPEVLSYLQFLSVCMSCVCFLFLWRWDVWRCKD